MAVDIAMPHSQGAPNSDFSLCFRFPGARETCAKKRRNREPQNRTASPKRPHSPAQRRQSLTLETQAQETIDSESIGQEPSGGHGMEKLVETFFMLCAVAYIWFTVK